jgi:hypothetical protein
MEKNPHGFVFEIDLAIRTQVIQKLEASPELKLSRDVAPGKALLTTLRKRLNEHFDKIAGRKSISVGQMTCRFLTIESEWFVRAAEDALIA